jgi:hypothetical protein
MARTLVSFLGAFCAALALGCGDSNSPVTGADGGSNDALTARWVDGGSLDAPFDPSMDVSLPCGAAGQRCCAGGGCADGGCCVGERCIASGAECGAIGGVCSAGSCQQEPNCGAIGQPCCAGVDCTASQARCFDGVCGACGAAGQPCCADRSCAAAGLYCASVGVQSQICAVCGKTGQACCPDGSCTEGGCCVAGQCLADDASCGEGLGQCRDGICDACGAEGQPCCPAGGYARRCSAEKTICDGSRCIPCGGEGERCCTNRGCQPGLYCPYDYASGMDQQHNSSAVEAEQGAYTPPDSSEMPSPYPPQPAVCRPCGGPDQRCCDGDRCQAGGCCLSSRCVASGDRCVTSAGEFGLCGDGRCDGCGAAGEQCCPTRPACNDGAVCASGRTTRICQLCGGPGQPCCTDRSCADGFCCDGTRTCIAPGQSCSDGGGICEAGVCGDCGGLGQPCCGSAKSWCSQSDTTCVGQICVGCGAAGERCCADRQCTGDLICLGAPASCV